MGFKYCLRAPVTAASMPGLSCAAVVRQGCRVSITRRLGGSSVNHRACAPSWHGRHATPTRSFARRIGRLETHFAQKCAQGDIHLHVGECRANATVDAAAEWYPRDGLCDGADESVGVE